MPVPSQLEATLGRQAPGIRVVGAPGQWPGGGGGPRPGARGSGCTGSLPVRVTKAVASLIDSERANGCLPG
eukprot:13725-Rhodomonas_salina.2